MARQVIPGAQVRADGGGGRWLPVALAVRRVSPPPARLLLQGRGVPPGLGDPCTRPIAYAVGFVGPRIPFLTLRTQRAIFFRDIPLTYLT